MSVGVGKVEVVAWRSLIERHTLTSVVVLVDGLVNRSEILLHIDVHERVLTRRHDVFGIFAVIKSEEICFGVESTVWNWLI